MSNPAFNPFDMAQAQFDKVAEILNLDQFLVGVIDGFAFDLARLVHNFQKGVDIALDSHECAP